MFCLIQKDKDEGKDLMLGLFKLLMNALYGIQIRKAIPESHYCKSECWMQTDYVDNVLDYWKLPNRKNIKKFQRTMDLIVIMTCKIHCLLIWELLFQVIVEGL